MTDLPPDIENLIEDFAFLEDWEDRYMHVIEMGKALPPLSEGEKNAANKVSGCVSQVWLVGEKTGDDPARILYRGDSDAHIVKGLVAVVLTVFSGRTAAEVRKLDAKAIIEQLGLSEHLSAQRANGLNAMIGRILADFERLDAAG